MINPSACFKGNYSTIFFCILRYSLRQLIDTQKFRKDDKMSILFSDEKMFETGADKVSNRPVTTFSIASSPIIHRMKALV